MAFRILNCLIYVTCKFCYAYVSSAVQVLVLLAMGLVIYLATSKYGNIRLGEGKPEYSTLSWLFMFICAGLALLRFIGGC